MPERRPPPRRSRTVHRAVPGLPVGPVGISTGTVEVVRDAHRPTSVTVLVNGVPSSQLDLEDPTWLEFEYMQQMTVLIDRLTEGPLDAVHLGAAGCALPRWVDATRPGSRQLAVDVDTELLTLVRGWFDLPRSPRLRLRPGDAREVLAGLPTASADLIIRDVFAPDTTPDHLCTAEFVAQVARVLRPGGLYLANCADRPPLALARAEAATVAAAMETAVVAEPGQLKGRRYGNIVLAALAPVPPAGRGEAWTGDDRLDAAALARALRSLPMPVHLLRGADLAAFLGPASPLRDPQVAQAPGGTPADVDEAASRWDAASSAKQ